MSEQNSHDRSERLQELCERKNQLICELMGITAEIKVIRYLENYVRWENMDGTQNLDGQINIKNEEMLQFEG